MNESRPMRNRTPPQECGEWEPGEPNAAARTRRVGNRTPPRERGEREPGEPNAAARMRRVWNRTPPRERGERGTERRRGSAASGNGMWKATTAPKIQKKETHGAEV